MADNPVDCLGDRGMLPYCFDPVDRQSPTGQDSNNNCEIELAPSYRLNITDSLPPVGEAVATLPEHADVRLATI